MPATIRGTPGTAEDAIAGSTHAVEQTFTADVSAFPDSALPAFAGEGARAGWLLLDVPAKIEVSANSYLTDYDADIGLWRAGDLAPVDISTRRELLTAVTFDDSVVSMVTVPADPALDLGDTFTLEAIVRRNISGFNQPIVSKGTGAYYLRINAFNRLQLLRSGTTEIVASTVALSLGSFHHCMAVSTPLSIKLYLDGVDVTGAITDDTCVDTSDDLTIGSDPWDFLTRNSMSHVAVYSIGLTAADAAAHAAAMGEHYRATVLGTAGLVALWGLGEASGLVAEDLSGNGHDGAYTAIGITYGVPTLVGGNGQRAAATLKRGSYLLGVAQHVDDPAHTALAIALTTWPADALLRMGVDDTLSVKSVEPFILGVEVVPSVELFDMIGPLISVASIERFEIQGQQAAESVESFDIEGPVVVTSEEPFSILGSSPTAEGGPVEDFPGGYVASPLIGWRDV